MFWDRFFAGRWEAFKRNGIVPCVSALVFGIIAHGYMFANKLPNYDEMNFGLGGIGNTVRFGRAGLEILYRLHNLVFTENVSVPWFDGISSLVLLMAAAVCLARIFEIRSAVLQALLTGLLVCYPAVVSTFFFMYTAKFYFIAVLFTVLSVYCLRRHGNAAGTVVSVVLMAAGLSIYQAYLPMGAGLLVICLMQDCVRGEKTALRIVGTGFYYVFSLLAGVVLYILFSRVSAGLFGTELSAYKGISVMGQLPLSRIPWMVREVYKGALSVFTADFYATNPTRFLRMALLALTAAAILLSLSVIMRKREGEARLRALLLIALLIIPFPFCVNGIVVMQPDSWFYTIMEWGVLPLYLLPLILLDTVFREGVPDAFTRAGSFLMPLGTACVLYVLVWFANGNYLSMDYAYRSAESYFTSMVTRIRSAEGYTDELPLYVLGWDAEIKDRTFRVEESLYLFNIGGKNDSLVHAWNWYAFVNRYLAYDQYDWDEETIRRIWTGEEAEKMPCYPDEGSIRVTDDGIIVKISDYYE